ncbi:S-layer homology domain-containing protein [Sporosarcina trichiuri]|uniref:S-layer homology domain-containing protein n=1 Tax=Sporosarcina trichiuri TaxID=3056445 RepID=UPI0025B285E3|nr:S-layer homology domain-containing protein [Sporosarcina sp. 0.2-SM1T-5]WJY26214.1 S-layer homology domain-containing protein [Sporosarcina sp. 0.2-SM1T-5]
MKRIAMFAAAITLSAGLAVQPAAAAVSFPDVPKSSRFHDEVQYLVSQSVISGYPNGKFMPKKDVTRAEAAIFIGRMLKMDGTKRATNFKDVGKNQSASGYIAGAVTEGILSGYPDGTYRPDAFISRGDMAAIVDRAFDLQFTSRFLFSDVGPNMRASESIRKISAAGITAGYPDGTFKPTGNVSREQFSAFLARGLSAEFKQRAAIADSFAHDKTKQYTYTGPNGDRLLSYVNSSTKVNGSRLGFVWQEKDVRTGGTEYFVEDESYQGFATGLLQSDYYIELLYPIETGKSWSYYQEKSTYTAVHKTVDTPYRTLANAVEVTTSTGYKNYYVKGVGLIKVVDKNGHIVSVLKAVK